MFIISNLCQINNDDNSRCDKNDVDENEGNNMIMVMVMAIAI